MKLQEEIGQNWNWGTAQGSRDLDRLLDQRLSLREKIQWLEEAEELSLRFQAAREKMLLEQAGDK